MVAVENLEAIEILTKTMPKKIALPNHKKIGLPQTKDSIEDAERAKSQAVIDKKEAQSDESKKIEKEPLAQVDKDEEKHLQDSKAKGKKGHKHHPKHVLSDKVRQVKQLLETQEVSSKEVQMIVNAVQSEAAESFCKAQRMIKILE